MSIPNEITALLNAWAKGDQTAAERLFPLIERELHEIAEGYMRHQPVDHTLQPTALVNEAYLKLAGREHTTWKDRGHFFAVASKAMRHILVDYARKGLTQKRGLGRTDLRLDDAILIPGEHSGWLVVLDEALRSFAKLDPRAAQVVELRFFGGLTIKETAKIMGISAATVSNDWATAQLWLMREIRESNER
ncbi:MAG: sigma-70 family RNA polymerase sigma factor [Acidobacteria bacterium]|nr:sigma-70 family RNA polymerase sigma factor [Acidobacteriota bacterium]